MAARVGAKGLGGWMQTIVDPSVQPLRPMDERASRRTVVRHAPARLLARWAMKQQALGRDRLARALFRMAISLSPRRARTWLRYGKALLAQGKTGEGRMALERALALDPSSHEITAAAVRARPRSGRPDRIDHVILGTTGLCNASCHHCPTGKPATAHVPRVPMAMPLFRRTIDQLAALGLPITGHIGFGLFGDALVDPFVVERVRYVRERFPTTPIAINTNAAAFDRKKHAPMREFGVTVALHSESLDADIFAELMHPLRLHRVLPKYEELLRYFRGNVHVTIPLSRRNADEAPAMREWFSQRGAKVFLAPLMSRCAEDRRVFDALAFAPLQMRCTSVVLDDLVIDCDGMVLRCCQDFTRAEPMGDLRRETLSQVIYGSRRRAHADMLDGGGHLQSATCSRCFGDPPQ